MPFILSESQKHAVKRRQAANTNSYLRDRFKKNALKDKDRDKKFKRSGGECTIGNSTGGQGTVTFKNSSGGQSTTIGTGSGIYVDQVGAGAAYGGYYSNTTTSSSTSTTGSQQNCRLVEVTDYIGKIYSGVKLQRGSLVAFGGTTTVGLYTYIAGKAYVLDCTSTYTSKVVTTTTTTTTQQEYGFIPQVSPSDSKSYSSTAPTNSGTQSNVHINDYMYSPKGDVSVGGITGVYDCVTGKDVVISFNTNDTNFIPPSNWECKTGFFSDFGSAMIPCDGGAIDIDVPEGCFFVITGGNGSLTDEDGNSKSFPDGIEKNGNSLDLNYDEFLNVRDGSGKPQYWTTTYYGTGNSETADEACHKLVVQNWCGGVECDYDYEIVSLLQADCYRCFINEFGDRQCLPFYGANGHVCDEGNPYYYNNQCNGAPEEMTCDNCKTEEGYIDKAVSPTESATFWYTAYGTAGVTHESLCKCHCTNWGGVAALLCFDPYLSTYRTCCSCNGGLAYYAVTEIWPEGNWGKVDANSCLTLHGSEPELAIGMVKTCGYYIEYEVWCEDPNGEEVCYNPENGTDIDDSLTTPTYVPDGTGSFELNTDNMSSSVDTSAYPATTSYPMTYCDGSGNKVDVYEGVNGGTVVIYESMDAFVYRNAQGVIEQRGSISSSSIYRDDGVNTTSWNP